MSDEITGVQDPQDSENLDDKKKEVVPVSEYDKLKQDYEMLKKTQQGVDKANSNLRERLEALEKAAMSAKEREEYEKQKLESEKLELENAKHRLEVEKTRITFFAEKKIESDLMPYVKGDTEDELNKNYDGLIELIERRTKPLKDELEKIKLDKTRPSGGGSSSSSKNWTDMSLDERNRFYLENPEAAKQHIK